MSVVAPVILAAGMGSRMKSGTPKVLHKIGGRAMISHLLATVGSITDEEAVVVVAPGMDDVKGEVSPARCVIQPDAKGTGHAVKCALPEVKEGADTVLVLYGDTSLLSRETLIKMIEAASADKKPAVVVLGFEPADPLEYGRLVLDQKGDLAAITEYADADETVRKIGLCNSGVMAIRGDIASELINEISSNNAKQEFYLTDIVEIANRKGYTCTAVIGDEDELLGVNNREQLANAEAVLQRQWRKQALESGVTLIDPDTVFFSHDTQIGQDVVIEPNVFFGPGVKIGDNCQIKAFSHLEGCSVENSSTIGPFARLRPGASLGENVKIGNFVEVKKSRLDDGAKVSHLSYIGDAHVGADANIGAGTSPATMMGMINSRQRLEPEPLSDPTPHWSRR
nr:bifunctional UDP-N-acetylglucosamine diphosphorylase/glucosamine-1-phosphate N-acetyltransferase GlmU [Sneathiella glossodoripedis]